MKYEIETRLDLTKYIRLHQEVLKRMPGLVEAHNPLKKCLSSHLLYSSQEENPTFNHPKKDMNFVSELQSPKNMKKRTNPKRINKTPFLLILPCFKDKPLFFSFFTLYRFCISRFSLSFFFFLMC